MKHLRPNRWTRDSVIIAIRVHAEHLGRAPTSGEMGAGLANACRRHCEGIAHACRLAGVEPNRQGRPAHMHRPPPPKEPVPEPKPDTFTAEPVVTEYQAHLARQRVRLAADAERIAHQRELYGEPRRRRGRYGRSDFYGRVKWDRGNDYLPPPDLLHFRGAA